MTWEVSALWSCEACGKLKPTEDMQCNWLCWDCAVSATRQTQGGKVKRRFLAWFARLPCYIGLHTRHETWERNVNTLGIPGGSMTGETSWYSVKCSSCGKTQLRRK